MLQIFASYSYTTTTTTNTTASAGMLFALFIPLIILTIFLAVCQWKVYVKAGKPGWAAIVPVYNLWVLYEITGIPTWLALLYFIPIVNFAAAIVGLVATFKLSKLFGKSDLFAVCSVFFPFVTYPILAYGSATFQGLGSSPQGYAQNPGMQPPYPQAQAYPGQPVSNPNQPQAYQQPYPQTPPAVPPTPPSINDVSNNQMPPAAPPSNPVG
jgi:hypothetical protein